MNVLDVKGQISLKNILFATDYSDVANAALPSVLSLARRYGSKVYAVHATVPEVPPISSEVSSIAWPAILREKDERHLAEAATLNPHFEGIPYEMVLAEGDAWEVISKVIQEHEIDLVVIGTRGRSGVGKVLLGSVAEKVFREAPCPVLTVGPHVTPETRQLQEVREIVYATDLTPASMVGVRYAVSLAIEHHARLTLLHVVESPKPGELVHAEQYAESTVRLLRNLVPPEAAKECEPIYVAEQGEPAEKILEVAKECKASLIVMGVRHSRVSPGVATHLAGGTVHKVVVGAACPVLTVRT
jgi:nucleotide-binding universal stress UspA family protein